MLKIQEDILNSTNKNELVSAGAGSGKTTVMINKIANLILNEKVPVENFLVVTFTVLASTEMKERLIKLITDKLETSTDKLQLLNIIEQIKTASIDTIDGFNSKTIKQYFYELDISPNIEIISDATRDYYLTLAMDKTLEKFMQTDKINVLLDLFSGNRRSLDNIKQMLVDCYFNIINLKDYKEFLSHALNEYKDSAKSEKIINDYLCNLATNLQQNLINNNAVSTKFDDLFENLQLFNKNLSLKYNLSILKNLKKPKFLPNDKKEIGVDAIQAVNDFFDLALDLLNNGVNDDFELKNEKIVVYFNYFVEILLVFIENYKKIKDKNNLIDFNDLNRLMLELLKKDNVKSELQQRYKYIFIDEYQDVNPLQDELLSSIVGPDCHLFMVGDVKQSIYGFRGASPEWFLNKYNKFKNNLNSGQVFDMNINFRSNPKILNFINVIFEKLMTKHTTDIDYKNDCMIEPQRDDIVDDNVKIMLVKDEKNDDLATGLYSVKNDKSVSTLTTAQKEAYLIANEITKLLGTSFYDANIKEYRTLTYKDIAILTHSEKDDASTALIEILKNANIPLNINNKLDVSSSEGIKLILSILKCVTNTADDVDYLAVFMALTDLTIDELIELRDKEFSLYENFKNSQNASINEGFKILEEIKNCSYVKTNSELIRYILNEQKLKMFFLLKQNGERELKLIDEFLQKLSPIENNLSLNEFVEVVNSSVSKSSDFNTSEGEDCVTLQTIHKSKGLEYPVVFLFNSSKLFSYLRENNNINFDSDLGLGIDYFDTANRTKCYSLTKYAIKIKNQQKGYKEEMRLLYVALTRAKNKLIITGQYNDKVFTEKVKKNCYTNMILSCFDNLKEGENNLNNCTINFIDDVKVLNPNQTYSRQVDTSNVNFVYPNADKFNISVKNTVTGLNSQISEAQKFNTKQWLNSSSQYNADEDRALIGTHYHKALESLDYFGDYIKSTDYPDVDYKKIELAHKNIKNLVKYAKSVKKEAEFMMYLPYNQLVESSITDKVLVQGVVDLIIEYENCFKIVDYKFSALPANVLKEKYAEQLKLYKQAVELAYHKPVTDTFIYSINSGELA